MTLRKFTLAILLTFTLTIAYQVFAAYLTSPENLKYPNPGHYPGEIGPGTFNCSNNTNCYWRFPNALFINSTSGKVGIGTENPKEPLEVNGSVKIQGKISADNYPPNACAPGYSIRQINSDGSVICEKDDIGITSESDPLSLHKTGGTIAGDLNVTGGIVVGNPAGGNKGPGTINAQKIYVNGSEVSFEGKIKVWTASKSDYDSASLGETLSVNCSISIPDGYTVIYAHGGMGESYLNEYCKYPSFIIAQPYGSSQSASCEELNCLGQTGGVCENSYSRTCHSSTCKHRCGSYVIAIKIE